MADIFYSEFSVYLCGTYIRGKNLNILEQKSLARGHNEGAIANDEKYIDV